MKLRYTLALFFTFCLVLGSSTDVHAQATSTDSSAHAEAKIIIIGEEGKEYNDYYAECPEMLLAATGGSIEDAFGQWLTMMTDVQKFAESIDFELGGVKLWINAYWNADGTIRALAYYPKPNSRNIEIEKLRTFFMEFAKQYKMDLKHDVCYSHYGSASFPVILMGGK